LLAALAGSGLPAAHGSLRSPFAVRGAPDGRASLSPFAFPRASRWSALAADHEADTVEVVHEQGAGEDVQTAIERAGYDVAG
jgi:hypothetical protein